MKSTKTNRNRHNQNIRPNWSGVYHVLFLSLRCFCSCVNSSKTIDTNHCHILTHSYDISDVRWATLCLWKSVWYQTIPTAKTVDVFLFLIVVPRKTKTSPIYKARLIKNNKTICDRFYWFIYCEFIYATVRVWAKQEIDEWMGCLVCARQQIQCIGNINSNALDG